MKKVLILLSLLSGMELFSQNLVPNPNFEEKLHCPPYVLGTSFLDATSYWHCPLGNIFGMADYYHSCDTSTYHAEDPSGGNAYIGLLNYWKPVQLNPYLASEYVQTELNDSLIQSQTYYIHFLFRYPNISSYVLCENIGMRFSDLPLIQQPNYQTLGYDSLRTIDATGLVNIFDTTTWFSYDTMYTAQGGENFVTIGNFRDLNTATFINNPPSPNNYAYIYVDNVYVGLTPPTVGCMDSVACTFSDTADINDTSMCIYPPVISIIDSSGSFLQSVTSSSNLVLWSTGETSTSIIPDSNDTYWVIAYNGLCESDTAWVTVDWVKTGSIMGSQNNPKKLLRIVDTLGRKTEKKSKTVQFLIYNDGTVEKRIFLD